MNYQTADLVNDVLTTAAPARAGIRRREPKPVTRCSPAAVLARECQRLTREQVWEDWVWVGLSASALAALVLSLV